MSASTNRPDYAREIRYALTDARALCDALGLLARGKWSKQPRGVIVACPWHDDRSPSCSVRVAKDGTISAKCFSCDQSGDALALIAQVRGISLTREFPAVLLEAAELAGLHAIAHELRTGAPSAEARQPAALPPVSTEPERDYPARSEVLALWERAGDVSDDHEAAAWLRSRGMDRFAVAGADVVRCLPPKARLPRWASYRGRSWVETGHRLVFAMRDASGSLRSLRACRIVEGDSPKRLPPGGHRASGLVLACGLATAMLAGTYRPRLVVISEGEPDFLTWASRPGMAPTARIGIVSGSWSESFAARFPSAAYGAPCTVVIRTDRDEAGTRYAKEIAPSLQQRGCLVRWTPREVRHAA